jgi:hypothetical protein
MKNLLFIILVTLTTISSKSQHKEAADEINVLFIGNSLTYFYDSNVSIPLNEKSQ